MAKKQNNKKNQPTVNRKAEVAKAGSRRRRAINPPSRKPNPRKLEKVFRLQLQLVEAIINGATRSQVVSLGAKLGLTGDQVAAITGEYFLLDGTNLLRRELGEPINTDLSFDNLTIDNL